MTKNTSSTLERDLTDDYEHNGLDQNTRRLNGLENRLSKVEKKLDATYDSPGEHLVRPHPRPADDKDQAAAETESLRKLRTPYGVTRRPRACSSAACSCWTTRPP